MALPRLSWGKPVHLGMKAELAPCGRVCEVWGVSRSRTRVTLGRIRCNDGVGFLETIQERFEELAHGRQGIVIKKRAHPLPQQTFPPQLRPDRLEQRTTQLLGLIHSER